MNTLLEKIDQVYADQRDSVLTKKETTYSQRINQLNKLYNYLKDKTNESSLQDAIYADFSKPKAEVIFTEYIQVLSHIKYIKKHLKSWMRPKKISNSLAMTGLNCYVQHQSKGHVLIIAPWNYPFFLSITPLLYAIAAGCRIVLKPSEFTAHTSLFIEKMIEEIYDEREVCVVQGAVKETTHLLEHEWNHIFFTGSSKVGKIVMNAASNYLASVTLELGGKSPCIIDESADLKKIANRLIWGKMVNAGQTCVAPDYVLISERIKEEFIQECIKNITHKFGDNPKESASFCRVVSQRHTDRLRGLLEDATSKGARVRCGGEIILEEKYVSPTLIDHIQDDMKIMQEEIFGPILPIIGYSNLDEAIKKIQQQARPLSLYIGSEDKNTIRKITHETNSGGVVVNEFLLGAGFPEVPFGGINNSGIGKSYGKHGFIEFTNEKAVIKRSFFNLDYTYPPYTTKVYKRLDWFKRLLG